VYFVGWHDVVQMVEKFIGRVINSGTFVGTVALCLLFSVSCSVFLLYFYSIEEPIL